ncbi:SulP family inorganic anion transporter [Zhihengliuella sp.]|uniref:SulP family inorganic anion transporter n=1 Tax=Zhihengliuella sp. TaxID=1954483 RepID=UPI00281119A8|nr:SulP family inorganic anion transporter [Zhihengliuella sp.]
MSTSSSSPPATSRARSQDPGVVPGWRVWLRHDARFDVPASLVVFLVAVPLSLGIAVASGAPVAAGLIAAVVGGIVAGLFGGSVLQVSGPAAGLTVVVAEVVAQFGWAATCAITAAAGILQIVLGVTRLGRYALAISPTVVSAMLAGIGISIVLGQLNVALGGNSESSPLANVEAAVANAAGMNPHAVVSAAGVVVLLLRWPRMPARARAVPGQLVAVAAVTVAAALWLPGAERVDLGGDLSDALGNVALPEGTPLAVAGAVLTIALIASVESLLSAVAVDKLHQGRRADLDRELVGQGLSNSASGLLGGLPVTGVIVRSSTNVAAGARTRASAVLHGVWVLLFALVLVGLIEQIPLAALAGLLIVMGVNLVRRRDIAQARARGELWIYAVTVLGVLLLNLIEGVLLGLLAAVALVLWRVLRLTVDVRRAGEAPDGRELWLVDLRGSLTFLAMPMVLRHLQALPEGQVVEVDLLVDYLDPAARDHLSDWVARYEQRGGDGDGHDDAAHHGGHDRTGRGPTGPASATGLAVSPAERPRKAAPVSPRGLLPWGSWLRSSRGPAEAHPLVAGVREYHRRQAPRLRDVYRGLAAGQEPRAFFLGCVDSRLVPNLITSSGPGDLLTARNMGNLVPGTEASVSAPLLFAVDELGVDTVIVCGHSSCGALRAVLAEPAAGAAPGPVGDWLAHAAPAIRSWRAGHPVGARAAAAGLGEHDQLAQVNVAVALDQLERLLDGRDVRLIGLFLDVADGTLQVLHGDRFEPLTDAEADLLRGAPGTLSTGRRQGSKPPLPAG